MSINDSKSAINAPYMDINYQAIFQKLALSPLSNSTTPSVYQEQLKLFFPYQKTEHNQKIEPLFEILEQKIEHYSSKKNKDFTAISKSFIELYSLLTAKQGDKPDVKAICFYLPRFTKDFGQLFQFIDLETTDPEIKNFGLTMLETLSNLTTKMLHDLATDKFLAIQLYYNPENSSEVCIYDKMDDKALTVYLPYNSNNLRFLLKTKDFIREKSVKEYCQNLPLMHLDESFQLFPIYRPLNKHIEGTLSSQIQFEPEDEEPIESFLKAMNTPSQNVIVQAFNHDHIELSKDLLPAIEEFADATVDIGIPILMTAELGPIGTLLAPIASVAINLLLNQILESLFGQTTPKAVTMQDVTREISNLLSAAQGEVWTQLAQTQLTSLGQAILQKWDTLQEINKHVKERKNWQMGNPKDWESIVNIANTTKEYFFNNSFQYHYQISLVFPIFLYEYTRILTGKIFAKQQSHIHDYTYEISCLKDCYIRAGLFIEKIMEQAWNKSVDYMDFSRQQTVTYYYTTPINPIPVIFNYYAIIDNYNRNKYPNYPIKLFGIYPIDDEFVRYYDIGVSNNDKTIDYLGATVFLLETQLRNFVVLSSQLYKITGYLDKLCTAFNKSFIKEEKDFLPDQYQKLYVFDRWQHIYNTTFDYALMGYYKESTIKTKYRYDERNEFFYCQVNGEGFDLGDYPILNLSVDEHKTFRLPRGVFARVYAEENFKGENIAFTDDYIPKNIKTIKSMYIKLLMFYFPNPHTPNAFSRLPTAETIQDRCLLSDFKTISDVYNPWKPI